MNALQTSTFGKYQLIASLGQGGMANVYLALVAGPGGFNKLLVIKSMRAEVVENIDGGLAMFLDEARLTARLVHPNIAATYEVGQDAGTYFIAMEYLEGQTFRALTNRGRPDKLAFADELRVLSEAARGLHYVHELQDYDGTPLHVVHRDVSPPNVFVTYDGQVKLLDFGIAKTAEAEASTQVGVIKGKIDYMPPEQLRGEEVDRRADVFALGAMLWESITRRRFAGGSKLGEVAKVQNRLNGGERKVRDVQPNVPEPLAEIVDRALALKPEDRFATAAELADAIDGWMAAYGLKPTAKTLSAAITPLFESERQQMRKVIEEQIQKQRGAERTGSLPSLRPGDDNTVNTAATWVTREADSQRAPASPLDSLVEPPRRSRRQLITAVAVFGLAAFVGGTLALRSHDKPAAELVSAPAAIAPPPPVEQPAPKLRLQLNVVPASAQVTLDDAPLTTPFNGELPRDGALHPLLVKAEGYRPYKQMLAFERDALLQVTLEKLPAVARRPRTDVRTAKNDPRNAVTPKGRAPVRQIDTEDPYADL